MNKTLTLCLSFFCVALFILSCASAQALAVSNCTQLNNGGITNKQYCFNPTPVPQSGSGILPKTQITPLSANQPQQTKGGQKIFPTQKSKTTPSTGPQDWSVLALLPLGVAGLYMRKKAQISLK